MIGLVLSPSLDHKANNANIIAIILLEGRAGDGDPALNDFLYCLIKRDQKTFILLRLFILKETPGQRQGRRAGV